MLISPRQTNWLFYLIMQLYEKSLGSLSMQTYCHHLLNAKTLFTAKFYVYNSNIDLVRNKINIYHLVNTFNVSKFIPEI